MAILQVRIDDDLKNQASAIYNELGIDLSTAVRMFLKKTISVGGIPFDTKVEQETLGALLAFSNMRGTSEKNGNSNMTLDDINEEIKQTRRERKDK